MRMICGFCLLVVLTFCSCGKSSSQTGKRIGIDASWYPLQLGNRDTIVTTFSTELLAEIGKVEKIPLVKVSVNWDDLMSGLQKDKYEAILTSMPPYIFNEKMFDFSNIYLYLGPVLVVPIDSSIHSLDNLSGKEIAVISGSNNDALLQKTPGILIRYFGSTADALNNIVNGGMDGAIIDVLSAVAYCKDIYQGQLKIATDPLTEEGLRLITKHGKSEDLIKKFNEGLDKLKKEGTYEKLLIKWGLQEPFISKETTG